MGVIKTLRHLLNKPFSLAGEDSCVKEAERLLTEQKGIQERLDRIRATLNGEEGWFLTFHKPESGEERRL